MANREVNLTKRVKTASGLRYCPVVLTSNGRVKQDAVMVDGKEEKHAEGAYYIEWRQGSKRCRVSVGSNATEAATQQLRKEAELNATNHGVSVVAESKEKRPSLVGAIADYLSEVKLTKKPRSYNAYSNALTKFQESCHRLYIDEVDRHDMLKFSAYLRDEKELSPRSVYNGFEHVMTFLKWAKIRDVVGKNDWPRFTEEEPEIYEPEELEKLFAACDRDEKLWFEFFLMTGMREQEVQHVFWSDVNLTTGVIRVTHKPSYNWTPKAYKERSIPVPDKLVEALRAHKARSNKACPLVFPTTGCKPKLDFLDCLKAVAQRAELEQDAFWLHKFRATFATRWLRNTDVRTVQSWLGHNDLASTMRYLKPAHNSKMRDQANAVFA